MSNILGSIRKLQCNPPINSFFFFFIIFSLCCNLQPRLYPQRYLTYIPHHIVKSTYFFSPEEMDAEEVLKLFDSHWLESTIFSQKPLSLPHKTTNPTHHQIQEPNFSRLPTLHVRSLSDQLLMSSKASSFSSESLSPNSVMTTRSTPKLQTIISGKDVSEFSNEEHQQYEMPIKKKVHGRKRRTKLSSAKSLSDLEFEELKGFMDLGFRFSEEDKDSRLVSIIPGLQRLGRKGSEEDVDEEERKTDENVVSRPYLSEAWDVLDKQKHPLMNWKISALGDEMDMKDQLKFWAHTVASSMK